MLLNWIMVAVGVWAMISPWVLGFSSISVAKWDSLVVGLVVVLLNVWIIFGDVSDDVGDIELEKDEKEKDGAKK